MDRVWLEEASCLRPAPITMDLQSTTERTPSKRRAITTIAGLSPNAASWTICAKVVKVRPKCEPKNISDYVKQYFKCWLKDDTATIEVISYNAHADYFEDKLVLDEVVYISGGEVRDWKRFAYADVFHDHEIVLNRFTSRVEPCDTVQDSPDSSFSQLALIKEPSVGEDTIDVVGVVEHVDPVEHVWTEHGETPLKNIIISDQSGESRTVTLWKEKAESFDAEVNSVVVLRRVKSKEFRGEIKLSSCMFTSIEVNSSSPEAEKLRRWRSDNGDNEDYPIRGSPSSATRQLFPQDPQPCSSAEKVEEEEPNGAKDQGADESADEDEINIRRTKTRLIMSDDEDLSDADTVDYNHSPARGATDDEDYNHSLAREATDDDDDFPLDSCTKRKRILSDSEEESDIGEEKKGKFKRIKPVESSLEVDDGEYSGSGSDTDSEGDDTISISSESGSDSDSGGDSSSESDSSSVSDSQESLVDPAWERERVELGKDPLFEKVHCYLYWMTMKASGEEVTEPDILANVQKLEGDIQVKLGVCNSQAWCASFRTAMNAYPDYRTSEERDSDFFSLSDCVDCEACNRSDHPWSYKVTFDGRPYSRNSYEEVAEDGGEDGSDYLFHLGRFCYSRSRLYSRLYHWSYHLFKKCSRKLDRLDDNPDEVLKDKHFLKEVYWSLKDLMETTLQEYTDDGNRKKRWKQREIDQAHI